MLGELWALHNCIVYQCPIQKGSESMFHLRHESTSMMCARRRTRWGSCGRCSTSCFPGCSTPPTPSMTGLPRPSRCALRVDVPAADRPCTRATCFGAQRKSCATGVETLSLSVLTTWPWFECVMIRVLSRGGAGAGGGCAGGAAGGGAAPHHHPPPPGVP